MERTVKLTLTREFLDAVGGLPNQEVERALGYLAHWAIGGGQFAYATIYADGKTGNLSALYFKDSKAWSLGEPGYEIFGLRETDGSYSFHS